jgi:hypothetical protein
MPDFDIMVDNMLIPARVGGLNRKWSHLTVLPWTSESLQALHDFAAKIGLKREWFQDGTMPHYDVTAAMRERAIREGARDVNWHEMGTMSHAYIKQRGGDWRHVGVED